MDEKGNTIFRREGLEAAVILMITLPVISWWSKAMMRLMMVMRLEGFRYIMRHYVLKMKCTKSLNSFSSGEVVKF